MEGWLLGGNDFELLEEQVGCTLMGGVAVLNQQSGG